MPYLQNLDSASQSTKFDQISIKNLIDQADYEHFDTRKFINNDMKKRTDEVEKVENTMR